MRNPLKERLDAGKTVLNAWSMLPSPFAAELQAMTGWHSVTFDMQHGLHDYASVLSCIQAVKAFPAAPLVRVPVNEPGIIGEVLDAGAWGVICPVVNTAADAKAFVDACLYPPLGRRSWGPIRAAGFSFDLDYAPHANNEILVLPMVETQKALDNLDAILDVPGISGIYIGPADLALSLNLRPVLDHSDESIIAIYRSLIERTRQRKLIAGIQTGSASYAAQMVDLGFDLVTVGNDLQQLAGEARKVAAESMQAIGSRAQ